MTDWFWPFIRRVLLLGALGIGLIAGLDHFGVLAAIGPDASQLLGMAIGAGAVLGAGWWVGSS
jgi:hypothetical protein